MRKMIWGCAMAVVLAGCTQKPAGGAAASVPTTEDDKTLYALGLSMGRQIAVFNLTPAELEMVKAGLTAQVKGEKPAVELETYGPKLQALAQGRSQARSAQEKEKGKTFLAEAAKEPGAQLTDKGFVIKHLTGGTGATPTAADTVKVHYRGTLMDGTEFDSSFKRNEPAQFPLGQVIPCWTHGVQLMKVGGKARLVCPSELAYGERGAPPDISPGATLIFEIELLDVVAGGQQQMAPPGHGPDDGHGH